MTDTVLEPNPGRVLTENEQAKCVVMSDPHQPDNPIVYASERFLEVTGYAAEEVVGYNCRFLQGPETSAEAVSKMVDALAAEKAFAIDLRNYCKDGTPFWNRLRVRPTYDADGNLEHFIGVQTEIPEASVNPNLRRLPILW